MAPEFEWKTQIIQKMKRLSSHRCLYYLLYFIFISSYVPLRRSFCFLTVYWRGQFWVRMTQNTQILFEDKSSLQKDRAVNRNVNASNYENERFRFVLFFVAVHVILPQTSVWSSLESV